MTTKGASHLEGVAGREVGAVEEGAVVGVGEGVAGLQAARLINTSKTPKVNIFLSIVSPEAYYGGLLRPVIIPRGRQTAVLGF